MTGKCQPSWCVPWKFSFQCRALATNVHFIGLPGGIEIAYIKHDACADANSFASQQWLDVALKGASLDAEVGQCLPGRITAFRYHRFTFLAYPARLSAVTVTGLFAPLINDAYRSQDHRRYLPLRIANFSEVFG
jgi:hypothetical protein